MARQKHPNDSHESGQVADWRLVYTILIFFITAVAASFSVLGPIYWALRDNTPFAAMLLLQDGITSAMALAMAYCAVRFTYMYPLFGFQSCLGTVLCAASLVRGG